MDPITEVLILLTCFVVVWIFISNFVELVTLNVDNIKVIQPPSVHTAPDIDVFNYYVKKSKQPPEQAWDNIVSLGMKCQTYEEFMESKKIDYRLKGILIMLLMEYS